MLKPKSVNFSRLVAAIIICQLAGIIGSVFTISSIPTWYASLAKPIFTPPSWLFGPVWIALYTLMGISLYLVWQKGFKKNENRNALYVFGAQLSLNAAWSIVFFGMRDIFGGLLVIIAMWLSIAATIIAFYKISKKAAWLLVPYMIWVSVATLLNFYLWQLN